MRRNRSVRWAVLVGCAVGCGGPTPEPAPSPVSPPAETPVQTPATNPVAPPPRELALRPIVPPADNPPRPYSTPSFTWRTTPASATAPVPASTPAPAPATPDPKPAEPEKPFEWPKDVNGKNLPEWLEDCRDPDPSVRDTAVRMIPSFGPVARKSAGRQIMYMIAEDPDPGVRMSAMSAAGVMGHETAEEIKPMVLALRTAIGKTVGGSAMRLFASRALASYGPEAVDAVPVLIKIYTDPWWETRQSVAQALGRVGAPQFDDPPAKDPRTGQVVPKKPADETARKYLIGMAESDGCAAVRLEAIMGLITLGPPVAATQPEYAVAIQPGMAMIDTRLNPKRAGQGEADPTVQIWLNVYHIMLDDRAYEATLPKLAGFLETPDANVRAQALVAIRMLGKRAATQSILDAIRDALMYDEEVLIAAAVDCLMGMGSDAAGLVPDLEKLKARTENKQLQAIADEGIAVLSGKKSWEDVQKERQKAADEAMKKAAIPPDSNP